MADVLVPRHLFVFDWDTPKGRNLSLVGFLALSFAVHAAGFYVFQIVYPPALSLPPQAARLTLITPNSEEGRTILRWLEAEDPAIASNTLRPGEIKGVGLPVVQHIPSYSIAEPALKHPPALNIDLRIPSAQPPGPVLFPRPQPIVKTVNLPTTVSFSEEIQALGNPLLPASKFVASGAEEPQAISFRIAVNRDGDLQYCFAENSSGDAELDEQARKYLVLCRFPQKSQPTADRIATGGAEPNSPDLVWGSATLDWGNDVQVPQSNSATPSSP